MGQFYLWFEQKQQTGLLKMLIHSLRMCNGTYSNFPGYSITQSSATPDFEACIAHIY